MKIGTIGAGHIAQAFTKHAAKAGYEVVVSNKSGAAALAPLVATFGPNVKAGTMAEAVEAEVVLFSVPWNGAAAALQEVPAWKGQILVDTTNALSLPDFKPLDLGAQISSEIIAELAPGARVVKAFNTLFATTLSADPAEGGGQRVIFISGDDAAAKATVLALIAKLGFAGIDLGNLATGGRLQQFGGPLASVNLVKLPG